MKEDTLSSLIHAHKNEIWRDDIRILFFLFWKQAHMVYEYKMSMNDAFSYEYLDDKISFQYAYKCSNKF